MDSKCYAWLGGDNNARSFQIADTNIVPKKKKKNGLKGLLV